MMFFTVTLLAVAVAVTVAVVVTAFAFFTVLERSGIDYNDMRSVASTTYSKLMDTNESVALEDPYLYYEIQHLNKFRESMLKEFDDSVSDVVEAALADNPQAFKELMDRGREYFT